jgi:hypothetical protein
MSEDPQPGARPDAPASPDVGQSAELAKKSQLKGMVAARLADQARLTTQAAKARRLTTTGDQPGMADLTPLRELLADLAAEARRLKTRERIARALRQAADVIDPPEKVS